MLAVIIPNFNNAQNLERLLPHLNHDIVKRIVIADGMSEDQSLKIAIAHDAQIAIGAAGRGLQLARGASWAENANWYLFLHADSQLPDDWGMLVNTHIQQYSDKAGYFRLKFDSTQFGARFAERMVRLRCFAWALPYGDQGLLISRQLYDEIGGYPDWPLFEDVNIVEKIGRRRLRALPGTITTSADKYERDGFFRRGWRNFKLLRRYKRGKPIESLLAAYT